MSDKSKVLCKYYVSGVCRFGGQCAFSHDFSDMQHQVCKFYLAGCCTYGDRCRYQHKRPDYWKAAQAARGGQQHQQQQQQQQSLATAARPLQTTKQQQQQQQVAAAAAPTRTGQNGGGGGGSSGGTHRMDPHARAWDAPGPQDHHQQQQQQQRLQLPRSLSGDGTGDRRPYVSSTGAAAAAAAGTSGRRSEAEVAESREDAAGGAHAAGAAEAAQYDEQADGYDEYDDEDAEVYGGGGSYAGYDQQYGQYYGGDDGGGDYGGGGGGGAGGGDEGLAIVDDDVGLELEAAAVAAGSRRPVTGPLGGGGGVEPAPPPPSSRWGAAQHPWEAEGEVTSTAGTADPVDPADVELCPGFSLQGRCAEGEDCALIHGLECEICHKYRIHPYNEEAADEHRATCRLRHERLEARLRSGSVECGICLEPVMDKPSVSERRFGLLSCDHPFCLACIRSWRGRTDDATLATDTAVRTCPICRTPSHFVTPSLVWPASPEEKAGIVGAYKDKLGSMDCKHFDFGEGSCPFSTSCFYRHMYRDGTMEELVLRRAGDADGGVRVVMPVRLSAFFDTPQAQALMSRRR